MQHQLKSISKAGIPEAIAKVELYRYLNEPEEAESICRDILAIEPEQQLARRMFGLFLERRAKAQLLTGCAAHILLPLVEEALHCFAEAEKIRPIGNDDSILRWNRCVRLLESHPEFHAQHPGPTNFESSDTPPIQTRHRGLTH